MHSNTGAAQQVVENRTDLLDLMTLDELNNEKDDLGLSIPYLAIYYDRPDILQYLHKRGVNLSLPCDPMNFGTPMFYAVSLKRLHIMEMLDSLGYSTNDKCDSLDLTPMDHALRLDDEYIIDFIEKKKIVVAVEMDDEKSMGITMDTAQNKEEKLQDIVQVNSVEGKFWNAHKYLLQKCPIPESKDFVCFAFFTE